ncbi:MAG: hypothetical protein AVDCRST_MAG11-4040, partial [uncultured Gemmatimonadaceae bacterium]
DEDPPPLRPPLRAPGRPRADRGDRGAGAGRAVRRGGHLGRPVAARARRGVPAGGGVPARRAAGEPGDRRPRQPRRRLVVRAARPRRRGAQVRELRAVHLGRARAGAPRAGGHPRRPEHLARRHPPHAHLEPAGHLDHRRPHRGAARRGPRALRHVALGRRAGDRDAPQPGEGRALPAPRPQGHPQDPRRVRRHGRLGGAVRPRPPGGGALHRPHEEGHGDLHGGHREQPLARRAPVVAQRDHDQPGGDRRDHLRLERGRLRPGPAPVLRAL